MALSPDDRRRYARHLSLAEIGEAGQVRLLGARFRLDDGVDVRAADAARAYLTRAGLEESPDAGLHVPLPTAEDVARRAGAAPLEPAVASMLGAFAAVEAIKGVLGVGTPAPGAPPTPAPTE
jgi:hypothetical protein